MKTSIKRCISVPEDCFILAYSADPDEMPHEAAFHLGLYCLPKYLFTSIQNDKVLYFFFICDSFFLLFSCNYSIFSCDFLSDHFQDTSTSYTLPSHLQSLP